MEVPLTSPPIPEGQRIFITGGAGFIGSSLVGLLVDRNEVVVYDTFRRDALSRMPYRSHPNLTVVAGDVLDPSALARSIDGSTMVVHCAAVAGIDTVIKSPVTTMRVNMVGSANVLDAAVSLTGVSRVVCFSTSEVFGQRAFRSAETDATSLGSVGEARWTYAVSKLAEEHLAIAYHRELGLATSVVRPFNVYGGGQVGEGAMRIFIERALAGEDIVIRGDGTQIRAWCHIDDMLRGVMLCLSHPRAVGESFNIGNQRAVLTIYGLASTVVRVLGSSSTIRFTENTSADIELRVPDVSKARDLLGFEAEVDLEDGIARTATAIRAAG